MTSDGGYEAVRNPQQTVTTSLPEDDAHSAWWDTDRCGCSHCEHEICRVCGALVGAYYFHEHKQWHRTLAGQG